jgi:hypothetical protein
MIKGIVLLGLGIAGAAYFLDEKKGRKRRARFKKNMDGWLSSAGDAVEEYSQQFGERAQQLGERATVLTRELNKRAQEYSGDLKEKAAEIGSNGWAPSARFVGALGSALAFYAAGRQGVTGALLRTLSLGMFTRALIASR